MSAAWKLDDIDWGAFDKSKVDPELLAAIKAAAMVEANAGDYVTYLTNVFHDDDVMRAEAIKWGAEEQQHGRALARWASLADPTFDFEDALRRFREGYSVPLETQDSIRGSQAGELIARCIVESGTTSFYSAVRDGADEPVLKQVAAYVAGDEMRHYKLFYDHYNRVSKDGAPSLWRRLSIALGRIREASQDDELGFAYYCANRRDDSEAYDHAIHGAAYERRAKGLYQAQHIHRLVSMTAKAVGLGAHQQVIRFASWVMARSFQYRLKKLRRANLKQSFRILAKP
jgi:hypothetical protein